MERWINPTTIISILMFIGAVIGTYTKMSVDLNVLRGQLEADVSALSRDLDAKILSAQSSQNAQISTLRTEVAVLDQHVDDLETDLLRRLENIEGMLDRLLQRQLNR